MAAKLSRLITNRGGMNPGGGAVRVSPGVYRMPSQGPTPMPRPMAMPQGQAMNQAAGQAGQALNQVFNQQQAYGVPRMPYGGGYAPGGGGGDAADNQWVKGPWAGGPPSYGEAPNPSNPYANDFNWKQQMPNTQMQAPQAPWAQQNMGTLQAQGAPQQIVPQQPDPNKLPQ